MKKGIIGRLVSLLFVSAIFIGTVLIMGMIGSKPFGWTNPGAYFFWGSLVWIAAALIELFWDFIKVFHIPFITKFFKWLNSRKVYVDEEWNETDEKESHENDHKKD